MGVLREAGRTRVSLGTLTRPEETSDELLDAVRGVAGSDFEVFGEVGRIKDGAIAYLARDLNTTKLVMLRLIAESAGGNNYGLDVARELDASIPSPESTCPRCGTPVRSWGRFCTQCGVDLWTDPRAGQPRSKESLLEAVREATREKYEILGEMPKAGGGIVYFARDMQTGRLEALRVRSEGGDGYSVGLTGVLRSLADSIAEYRPPDPRRR
jgi:hypothetical protein